MHTRSIFVVSLFLLVGACATTGEPPGSPLGYHLIPGAVTMVKGPDGNTVIFDAPEGLVVVDTGRHPEHVRAIIDHASARNRPVVAIVNTHWHFDHTTGNRELLSAYPDAVVVASRAVDGGLFRAFTTQSRKGGEDYLASGKATDQQRAEIARGFVAMDGLAALRPNRPVDASDSMMFGGRLFDVRLAPFAVTQGDVWLHVPEQALVVAGDLVVDIVPFMDTACAEGWQEALDEITTVPFATLVPGHGAPMARGAFLEWKQAFENFVACGQSARDKSECVAGWERDAAAFIDASHADYVASAAAYYIDTRLRAAPEERERYCNAPAAAQGR